jgi:hypothetical protein
MEVSGQPHVSAAIPTGEISDIPRIGGCIGLRYERDASEEKNLEAAENRTTNIQSSNPQTVLQLCTNPVHQVGIMTKFCTMALSSYVFSVRHLLHVTLLAPKRLRYLRRFYTISHPCYSLSQLIFPGFSRSITSSVTSSRGSSRYYTYF